MNTEFVRSFALLYAACIALICAVYVGILRRKKRIAAAEIPTEQKYLE